MKSKLGIALLWVLVFLLGGVAGAVGQRLYWMRTRPAATRMVPPKPNEIIDGMARELKLDAGQKDSLKAIFSQSLGRYRALGQQYRPQWEAIRNETDEQIKQMLRPDQRAQYEAFLKKVYSRAPVVRSRQSSK